ncbi:tRNA (uracil-5-)-methyltransferase homolog B [Rhynchocyon petersi]
MGILDPMWSEQEGLCAWKETVKEYFTKKPQAACNLTALCYHNCEFCAGQTGKIFPHLLKSKENGQLIVAVVSPACVG